MTRMSETTYLSLEWRRRSSVYQRTYYFVVPSFPPDGRHFNLVDVWSISLCAKVLSNKSKNNEIMNTRGRLDDGPGFVGIKFCQEW